MENSSGRRTVPCLPWTKEKYDAAVEELNSLLKKKKDADYQELVKLFDESPKTLEEVKAFLAEKTGQEDD